MLQLPASWSQIDLSHVDTTTLEERVRTARLNGPVFPAEDDVFRALALCPLDQVRAVIVGQDPYPTAGAADGLAFSSRATRRPASLRNIFAELHSDLGVPIPESNSLEGWARNGVLLLNPVLTVDEGSPGSHAGFGWEAVTDAIVAAVVAERPDAAWLLWGAKAQKKAIGLPRGTIIVSSAHPSPLSAYRGFLGSRPFSRTNDLLNERGLPAINWDPNPRQAA